MVLNGRAPAYRIERFFGLRASKSTSATMSSASVRLQTANAAHHAVDLVAWVEGYDAEPNLSTVPAMSRPRTAGRVCFACAALPPRILMSSGLNAARGDPHQNLIFPVGGAGALSREILPRLSTNQTVCPTTVPVKIQEESISNSVLIGSAGGRKAAACSPITTQGTIVLPGQNRCIGNPQPFHSVHFQATIDHRHVIPTHFGSATLMPEDPVEPARQNFTTREGSQCSGVSDFASDLQSDHQVLHVLRIIK